MADTAKIDLDVSSHDAQDVQGAWGVDAEFHDTIGFDRIVRQEVKLTDDNPKEVSLGDLPSAALVFVRVTEGNAKVRARLTGPDGTDQAISCDPVGFIISMSAPYTAIELTRAAGTASTVRVRVALGAPPA